MLGENPGFVFRTFQGMVRFGSFPDIRLQKKMNVSPSHTDLLLNGMVKCMNDRLT
jgi:hypothetical protein